MSKMSFGRRRKRKEKGGRVRKGQRRDEMVRRGRDGERERNGEAMMVTATYGQRQPLRDDDVT